MKKTGNNKTTKRNTIMAIASLIGACGIGISWYYWDKIKSLFSSTTSEAGTFSPGNAQFNNPFNIRYNAANNWQGQTGKTERGFVKFDTLSNGLRAGLKLLNTYVNGHNLNTVSKIINRYAPPSDNNPTENYIKYVENAVGKSSISWNKSDIKKLGEAILFFENGNSNFATPWKNAIDQLWEGNEEDEGFSITGAFNSGLESFKNWFS